MMKRFHRIQLLISKSFENGDFRKTEILANEYLSLASENKSSWNYGNAIHMANTYLGLVAMEHEDLASAKEYLLVAGRTPGSPQLNSFGPNMLLAKALLEKGERKVVLSYLDLCTKFWRWFLRIRQIRKWKKLINLKKIPDFGAHLLYHTNYPVEKLAS